MKTVEMTKTKTKKRRIWNTNISKQETNHSVKLAGEKVISSHKLHFRNYLELRQEAYISRNWQEISQKSVERVSKSFVSTFRQIAKI